MQTVKFVYWEKDGAWLADLKSHLIDLYGDMTSGQLPDVRNVDDLVVP